MGPNSGLFKCNPPDYIEKEDLVKRDLFARPFFEAGSRGYSVGSYFCPAIACHSYENCWTIVVFYQYPLIARATATCFGRWSGNHVTSSGGAV